MGSRCDGFSRRQSFSVSVCPEPVEGAKPFCQCHLVGQAQTHEPEHWWLGKNRGVPSGIRWTACVVCGGGSGSLGWGEPVWAAQQLPASPLGPVGKG